MTLKCFKTILNNRQGAEMLMFAEGTLTELSIFLSKGLWSSIAKKQFTVLLKTITQHWWERGGATFTLPKTNFCESGAWLRPVFDVDVSLRERQLGYPCYFLSWGGRKNKQNPCHLTTEERVTTLQFMNQIFSQHELEQVHKKSEINEASQTNISWQEALKGKTTTSSDKFSREALKSNTSESTHISTNQMN